MVYNAPLFAPYHVPMHTLILLRPEAAHANRSGAVRYAARPAEGLLAADLAAVARRLVARLERLICRAAKAARWQEILDTP